MTRASPSTGFRGIVFDLDGTLLDTLPDSHAALNRVFAEEGLRRLELDEVRLTVGEGARPMIRKALTILGRPTEDEAIIERCVRLYMEAYLADPAGHTVVYPGVRETLETLRRRGAILGVCTNKPRASARAVLSCVFPPDLFAAILSPEDVSHRKPDGRHVTAVLDAMGTAPDVSVMVGDSETDIAAAVDSGIAAVAVSYGYSHVPIDALPADAVIDRFADLPAALDRLAAARGLA